MATFVNWVYKIVLTIEIFVNFLYSLKSGTQVMQNLVTFIFLTFIFLVNINDLKSDKVCI